MAPAGAARASRLLSQRHVCKPCSDTNAWYGYDYAAQDPINGYDLNGTDCFWGACSWLTKQATDVWHYGTTHTVGGCLSLDAGFFVGGGIEFCGVANFKSAGLTVTPHGGFQSPGATATLSGQISNASNVSQLHGTFKYAGATAGIGPGVTATGAVGHNCGKRIWTANAGGGLALDPFGETHAGYSYTFIAFEIGASGC